MSHNPSPLNPSPLYPGPLYPSPLYPGAAEALTAQRIRAAEAPLIAAQQEEDQLMRRAATAVAQRAQQLLPPTTSRILIIAGSGGNGGDGLYAGAQLAATGISVDAILASPRRTAHTPALSAFRTAGGHLLDEIPPPTTRSYGLIIDALLGLGAHGGVDPTLTNAIREHATAGARTLAVDVPSGILADTGLPASPDGFIAADATVTFGGPNIGWRIAHAIAPECGQRTLADIGLGPTLWEHVTDTPRLAVLTAWDTTGQAYPPLVSRVEPQPTDDKYSGGVIGILAGSEEYLGAGMLSTHAAIRTTPAMVRYVGKNSDTQAERIVTRYPEAVGVNSLAECGRVQAWVIGPGRGTDNSAAEELANILAMPEPVVLDADALSLLAAHPELRSALRRRRGLSILTPHDREFQRLADTCDDSCPDLSEDRLAAVRHLAAALHATVLLKGRHTLIATPEGDSLAIDAGTSWAATPGSGDVLSGILGALLATLGTSAQPADPRDLLRLAADAVRLHGVAAALSARHPEGWGPTSASRIAEHIPRAWAWCAQRAQVRYEGGR